MAVELATAYVSLVPSARGISAAVNKELAGPTAAAAAAAGSTASRSFATKFASGMKSAGKTMSNAGRNLSIGVTLPFVLFGKSALDAAEKARTAGRQMNLVFEGSAGKVRDFARQNATSFGLTDRAMQSALAGFGGLTLSMGNTSKEAAGMTTQAGELAAALVNARPDLGSFDEVMAALSGGITENREEMKRWGVNVSDADIKARLASQGLEGLEGNALKQARAQAFLDLATESSALSLKDFRENGVDPTVKAENEMRAEAGRVSEEFGKNLTPIFTDVSKVLASLLERFNNLSPGMKNVATRAALAAAALGPVLFVTGKLASGIGGTITGIQRFSRGLRGVKTQGITGGIGRMARGMGRLTVSAARAGAAVARGFARMVAQAAVATGRVVAQIALQVARWVFLGVQSLLAAAKVAAAWLISLGPIGLVIAAVAGAAALIIKHWDTIKRWITTAARFVLDFLKRHWPIILVILTGPIGIAVTLIIKHWDKIKSAVSAAIRFVLKVVRTVIRTLLAIWRAQWQAVRAVAEAIWRAISERVAAAVRWVRDTVVRVVRRLRDTWASIWGAVRSKVAGIWGRIKTVVSNAVGAVRDKVLKVARRIRDGWARIWNSVRDKIGGIWDSIRSRVVRGVNLVIGVINSFIRLLNKIPGVNIGTIGTVGGGGSGRRGVRSTGRQLATGGMITNGPQFLVGEGNPAYPEAVIATDPKYRQRNLGLLAWAAGKLGVPGFQFGGIVGKAISGIGDLAGGFLDKIRELGAAALGPAASAAKAGIRGLPIFSWVKDAATGFIDKIVDVVRGKADSTRAAAQSRGPGGGSAPRGSGIAGLRGPLAQAVARVIAAGGGAVSIISGWRSSAKQAALYARYLAGTGNLAAPPGSSKHERGAAVDFGGNRAVYTRLARMFGLIAPVRGEPWHWEYPGFQTGARKVPPGGGFTHRDEMVLPARLADAVRRAIITGDTTTGGVEVIVQPGAVVIQLPRGATRADAQRAGAAGAHGFLDVLARRRVLTDARIA